MRKLPLAALVLLVTASGCMKMLGEHNDRDHGNCGLPPASSNLLTVARPYFSATGSPEIVSVRYWESSEPTDATHGDEEIILQAGGPTYIKGYTLQAGDAQTAYPLPDSLPTVLNIYAHTVPSGVTNGFALNLPTGTWLWNSTGSQTILLKDNTGTTIDSMKFTR